MSLRGLFFSEGTERGHEYGGKWRCGEAGRRKRRRNCDWVVIYERIIIINVSL